MKKIKIILLFLFVELTIFIQAQEIINASGGNITGSNGNVSLSIGQFAYGSYSGTNGYIIEGAQQPYEISVLSGIKNLATFSLSCDIYPNPSSDFIYLKLRDTNLLVNKMLRFQLFDVNGKVIQEDKIIDVNTKISLQYLKSSTYFLRITQSNSEKISFKIIKN